MGPTFLLHKFLNVYQLPLKVKLPSWDFIKMRKSTYTYFLKLQYYPETLFLVVDDDNTFNILA